MAETRVAIRQQAIKLAMVGITLSCLGAAVSAAPLTITPEANLASSREFDEIQDSCSNLPSVQLSECLYNEREAYDWAVANRIEFPTEKYPELSAKRISCWDVAKAGAVFRFTRYKNCVSSN
jgi:hypothetical protein